MPKVNPNILLWAREKAGLDLEDAASKLGLRDLKNKSAVEHLVALEKGESEHTRPMLLKMAKQYHRPLLTFYMSAPPKQGERGHDFRTLPANYSVEEDALLLIPERNLLMNKIDIILSSSRTTVSLQICFTTRKPKVIIPRL